MTYGLCLSGGGARGIMHIGVLQALEEFQIRPTCVSGCSAGSLIGALYSAGHSPATILQLAESLPILPLLQLTFQSQGLLNMGGLKKWIKNHLPATFEELQYPFHCNATDLEYSETVFFSKGSLLEPLMASCCIPLVFRPITIGEKSLVDGGIMNNLPVEPLLDQCDHIIGSHCNHPGTYRETRTTRAIGERSFRNAINQNTLHRRTKCWIYVDPPEMGPFDVMNISKAREMYQIGYQATLAMLEKELG
jgi:NTE family protein